MASGGKLLFKPPINQVSEEEITSKHTKIVSYAMLVNRMYNGLVRVTGQNPLAFIKEKNMGDYKIYYRPLIFSEILITSGLWEIYVKRKLIVTADEVFVDVGAHIGAYTIPVAKKAQKVIAFEPNKYSFELLTKNISLNHLTNITAYNLAVSKKSGTTPFCYENEPVYSRIIDSDQSSKFTAMENAKGLNNNINLVDTIDLDSVLSKEDRIDWIKIDVEGHELDVLKGAMQTIRLHKPKIIIELLSRNLQRLKTIAHSLGYSIESIYRDYFFLMPY